MTALHMHHLEQSSSQQKIEYRNLAEKHHSAGLHSFPSGVSNIEHSNFKAVLLFATVLFPYSCATSVTLGNDLEHAFESVLSNFALIRRTRTFADSFHEEMMESELSRMIPDGEAPPSLHPSHNKVI